MRSLSFYILVFLFSFLTNTASALDKKKIKGKEEVVHIETSYGEIVIILFDKTPDHKKNFIQLAKDGFYNGTTFHRVLKGFMIQGGDPNTRAGGDSTRIGIGNPGYTVNSEFDTSLLHDYGMVGAARQNDEINPDKSSSGSQFYIVQSKEGAHHLDGEYTVFGMVVKGMDVVEKIADLEINTEGKPLKRVEINIKVVKEKRKNLQKMYDLSLF
ncbi:peptidylprolyl isomerase [Flammeovirga aprica]|uniref:Peptidyl-prolyl cis-trans isomerase n=1 Tax=Flammeovirga aprica JL-4 TaxID=694437 RepID=A0A7X9RWU3_9BACT|nr:peptidylprolyl isomerase [Flammeovirga aprica]NME70176.1 peptidylprolyl isomerase [Flammeovirga aprica JL-4]